MLKEIWNRTEIRRHQQDLEVSMHSNRGTQKGRVHLGAFLKLQTMLP